jgi:Glu-tRNA(Gln) amidotransferase subunit E-like FAD-binding protein
MQTLLIVAVVVIALAIITQAGALVAMYLLSRKITDKVQVLMNETERLMTPLESITSNLKTTSVDLAETGKIAREQILQIQAIVAETRDNIRTQIGEVRGVVRDTVDEARTVVMRPIRQYSAIASAIAEGVRTLFYGGKEEKKEPVMEETIVIQADTLDERRYPAA